MIVVTNINPVVKYLSKKFNLKFIMMKTIKLISILILSSLMFTGINSCGKYQDGPALSLVSKEKRVVNSWKLEKYYWNGTDATNSLLISNYTEEYSDIGIFNYSYTDKDGELETASGTWEFDDNKENIRISGVSSIELTDENSTVTNTECQILRLKSDELWYSFENGGDIHEFRFNSK